MEARGNADIIDKNVGSRGAESVKTVVCPLTEAVWGQGCVVSNLALKKLSQ